MERYLTPADSQEKLLQDVRYEGNVPGGPFIVVKFDKPMKFQVSESNGLNGLIVNYRKN
jgi:hypothetical protein